MKKILLQLFVLVLLIAAGYGLLRAYPEVFNQTSDDVVDVPPLDDTFVPPAPGTYVIFQTTRVVDRGTEDWANDDTEETGIFFYPLAGAVTPSIFTNVLAGPDWDGLVWSEVVGQEVLVHRASVDGDGLVGLDGQWVKMESGDGRRIANRDGSVWVDYAMTYDNRAATVSMNIQNSKQLDNNQNVVHVDLDPAELGISLGYAEPFMISDDGSQVYVRQICECDAIGLTGFWVIDVATQKLTSVGYLSAKGIHQYEVNPTTKQLIGVSNVLGEDFTQGPSGPSAIHLVDLTTGVGKVLQSEPDDSVVLGNPFLSDDGSMYSFDLMEGIIRTAKVGTPNKNYIATTDGRVLAWVDGWMVLDRDGAIVLHRIADKTETVLARSEAEYSDSDYVRAQFVGVITVK